jgi:ADP-ribosylglycohydrolase
MAKITISAKDYCDKAYACWLGKCIGGTLGRPLEGKRGPHRLTFYRPIPHKAAENDDLDIQLVWLHALRERGVGLTSDDLAGEWLEHIIYWFDEYRFATSNLKRGLCPPMSGWFNNWYKDSVRSSVRSEIWAMISPGSPETAVAYATKDAIIDHSDEGLYGELFLAAVESAAFVISDTEKLLKIGLAAIPPDCRVSRAVQDVATWHGKKGGLEEVRQRLLDEHGSDNYSDAPQNIGIITLAWLHGEGDFEKGILSAVNCGLHTDCNVGSLGSLLGILQGRDGIPPRWKMPIKGKITPGRGIVGFEPSTDIEVLTEETLEVAKAVLENGDSGVRITATKPKGRRATGEDFGDGLSPLPMGDDEKLTKEHRLGAAILKVRFRDYPTISYDKPAEIELIMANSSERSIEGHIDVVVPWGWQVEPKDGFDFSVRKRGKPASMPLALLADEKSVRLLPTNPVTARVSIKGQEPVSVDFNILGERRWLIAGPYGKKGARAFERPYLPEKALAEEKPRGKVVFSKASFPEFSMDVNRFFGSKKEGAIYAFGWFYSSRKRDLRLFASCNDGIKVWLNDRLVLARHHHYPIRPPQYRSDIQVQRGWNRLLLKVVRCGDPVELHFYFGDRKNHVYNDLIDTYFPPEVLSFAG